MEACRNIKRKLSAYQDRELGSSENNVIENHLHTCEACRKEYEVLQQTYRMLMSLSDIEPPLGVFRQAVDTVTQQEKPVWIRSLKEVFRLLPVPAAVVTLAATGLLLGMMLGNLLTEGLFHSSHQLSASVSDQAPTLASVRVFDATPPDSFAGDYLKLAAYNPEMSYEK